MVLYDNPYLVDPDHSHPSYELFLRNIVELTIVDRL